MIIYTEFDKCVFVSLLIEVTMNHSCPYNSFCEGPAFFTCNSTSMLECSDCSYGGYIAVIFVASILGLAIVFGNFLTIWIFAQQWKNGQDMKMNAIKLSLAVSDLITGAF